MRLLNKSGSESKPDSAISQIEESAQDKRYDFADEAYDASTIGERELKFAKISGTMYLYTRKDDTLYRVPLTAV